MTGGIIEETIRKSYEARINWILKEIGSVQNARHAIHYRDCLQMAIEWKRERQGEEKQ